jgi:hypothetical protein
MAATDGAASPQAAAAAAEEAAAVEKSFRYAALVADYMAETCAENAAHLDTTQFTRFHSSGIPNITLQDYFRRIAKYSHCSAECFIVALIYIRRYSAAVNSALTLRNAHRLSVVALMVAAKLRDDVFFANKYYSCIGGINGREVNDLELDLLVTIHWATWVEREEYENMLQQVTIVSQRRARALAENAQVAGASGQMVR